jgi:AcrR family transcriptional regulator
MRAVAKAAPGRPSTFNRDDMVDCALALMARDGVEAMSLRGMARELGCVLGTVNYHFANLADLKDAVTARLLERLPIEVHSTYPHVLNVSGPISIEIAAHQLRREWSTLQALGLPEPVAMLVTDVLQSLARARGTEMYRLRHGGEQALRLNEMLMQKLGMPLAGKITADRFTADNMAPYHRVMLGTAIDTFLRGSGIAEPVKKRPAARKAS